MAASEANRPLIYVTFHDKGFSESFWVIYNYLIGQQATVRHLCIYLKQFSLQLDKYS